MFKMVLPDSQLSVSVEVDYLDGKPSGFDIVDDNDESVEFYALNDIDQIAILDKLDLNNGEYNDAN